MIRGLLPNPLLLRTGRQRRTRSTVVVARRRTTRKQQDDIANSIEIEAF
jgi:hypothetical protein